MKALLRCKSKRMFVPAWQQQLRLERERYRREARQIKREGKA